MPPNSAKIQSMRSHAGQIFEAGWQAVMPHKAIAKHCRRSGDVLSIGTETIDLSRIERVFVIGAGKASAAMAQAVEALLAGRIQDGLVVVKYGHTTDLKQIRQVEAGHPIPDSNSLKGTRQMLNVIAGAGDRDLVLCLISGGGSALMTLPAKGLTLAFKQQTTDVLLACGATIHEINTLRKHLSAVKGGRLARAMHPARSVALILSDVVGDDLDVIASGPTVPDNSTFADCIGILEHYGIKSKLPQAVVSHLQKGAHGHIPESPKPGNPFFSTHLTRIVGCNRDAIEAARQKATALGYRTLMLSSEITGETRQMAAMHAAMAREILISGQPAPPPACLLSGGETTVTLRGHGKGGRNQEFALAAALQIAGRPNIVIMSAGTDGTDGPTDAAGAIADHTTCQRAQTRGLNPADYLNRNDAYPFFTSLGDLVQTGPTRTNVMDLHIVLADT